MTTPQNARRRLAALPRYTALNGEDFTGQSLASARPPQLRFTRCSFVGVDLRGASLRGARLLGCDLSDADLRDADLTDAKFGRVNTGRPPHGLTNLTGARLKGAILQNAQRDGVIGWPAESDDIA
ncbi:pentapeptide repeat-containing protein [Streptomyces sp. TLI_171]|uniref:pentapeptide repeat-containing protein n=1 Tax=Streptomyces sp. TLI_171 TaxID=1938859 RepID=UPI000C1A67E1|nr:pentapeptide repeat-containing protein [Streptomyces sp. TLI_171]